MYERNFMEWLHLDLGTYCGKKISKISSYEGPSKQFQTPKLWLTQWRTKKMYFWPMDWVSVTVTTHHVDEMLSERLALLLLDSCLVCHWGKNRQTCQAPAVLSCQIPLKVILVSISAHIMHHILGLSRCFTSTVDVGSDGVPGNAHLNEPSAIGWLDAFPAEQTDIFNQIMSSSNASDHFNLT